MKEFFTVVDGVWFKGVFLEPVPLEDVLVEITTESGGGTHKMKQFSKAPIIAKFEQVPDDTETVAERE